MICDHCQRTIQVTKDLAQNECTEKFLAYSDEYCLGRGWVIKAVNCTQLGYEGCGSLYGRRIHNCKAKNED